MSDCPHNENNAAFCFICLHKRIAELEDPDWQTYIAITTKWLEKYPPHILTGVSGYPGPLFVVAVRKALAKLLQEVE